MNRALPLVAVLLSVAAAGCVYEAAQESSTPAARSSGSNPTGAVTSTEESGAIVESVADMRAELPDLAALKGELEEMVRTGRKPNAEEIDRILEKVIQAEQRLADLEARLEKLEH